MRRRGEYSTPDTIASALDRAARLDADGRGRFAADPVLSSWPGIVHGGALVAALEDAGRRLGGPAGPRRVEGRLTSSVPVDTALGLEAAVSAGAVTVSVLDGGQPLTSATISALDPAGDGAPAPTPTWPGGERGVTLPMSDHCLACGADNPLGLRVALAFDDEGVWARLRPRAPWRTVTGGAHPALAPVVLDEVAWWLGALVMQAGGLTNRITVWLVDPDAATPAGDLVAAGRFADVTPVDRRRTFWRTATTLLGEGGRPLATASIVFRGGPEYSARQLPYFRSRTGPDVFRRMFPAHAG